MTTLKIDTAEHKTRIRDVTKIANKRGYDVEVCKLEVGDYLWEDDGIVIEYKTASDFISSINDKRLVNECMAMKEQYEYCYLIFLNNFNECYHTGANKYTTSAQVYGALESVATQYRPLQLVPYETKPKSLEGIFNIYEKSMKGQKVENPVKITQNKVNIENPELYMIMSLPKIGEKTALKIMQQGATFTEMINTNYQVENPYKLRKETIEFIESLK